MKKATVLIVLFLLLLSIFSIAEVAEESAAKTPVQIIEADSSSSTATCGFWCKINTFLFGSAENRAGKGWFDRKEALVGMER